MRTEGVLHYLTPRDKRPGYVSDGHVSHTLEIVLTTDNSASSYGLPVLIDGRLSQEALWRLGIEDRNSSDDDRERSLQGYGVAEINRLIAECGEDRPVIAAAIALGRDATPEDYAAARAAGWPISDRGCPYLSRDGWDGI